LRNFFDFFDPAPEGAGPYLLGNRKARQYGVSRYKVSSVPAKGRNGKKIFDFPGGILLSFEIMTVPFNSDTSIFNCDDLNRFCLNKRVISHKSEFFNVNGKAFWSVFLEYDTLLETKDTGPETRSLTEAGKLCYEKLRVWRRERAEKEGVPPFVIARNSQLVDIIKNETKTLEALKMVNGFGNKKVEKYGKDITGIISAFFETAP
jgi:superfamily II DNA helicase RecQ